MKHKHIPSTKEIVKVLIKLGFYLSRTKKI